MKDFPIICVGGSAGGLDAYIRLLQNPPPDMGVAIVIVILNHITCMATRLHEVLPNRDLHVADGVFHLQPISKPRGWPEVIMVFLRSLSQNSQGQLFAVIVSGYDGDGAAALCGIHEAGGITLAQLPGTVSQPAMPESAITSACIDFVLPAEEIAQKIASLARHACATV